jgi:hypothetical protein
MCEKLGKRHNVFRFVVCVHSATDGARLQRKNNAANFTKVSTESGLLQRWSPKHTIKLLYTNKKQCTVLLEQLPAF